MTTAPTTTAVVDAADVPEVARLLRELRQLRDDLRDEARQAARLRESLEDAVDRVSDAWIKMELAVEDLEKPEAPPTPRRSRKP